MFLFIHILCNLQEFFLWFTLYTVLNGVLVCVIQLQRDEQQEREKRFQALESAMEKQRQEHGALLPAKKVQALYEALEQKDAQIYCKRAKV